MRPKLYNTGRVPFPLSVPLLTPKIGYEKKKKSEIVDLVLQFPIIDNFGACARN